MHLGSCRLQNNRFGWTGQCDDIAFRNDVGRRRARDRVTAADRRDKYTLSALRKLALDLADTLARHTAPVHAHRANTVRQIGGENARRQLGLQPHFGRELFTFFGQVETEQPRNESRAHEHRDERGNHVGYGVTDRDFGLKRLGNRGIQPEPADRVARGSDRRRLRERARQEPGGLSDVKMHGERKAGRNAEPRETREHREDDLRDAVLASPAKNCGPTL